MSEQVTNERRIGPALADRPVGKHRTDLEVDVSDVIDLPGRHVLRGWLREPSTPWPGPRPPLVYCLAGGRCTTAYFDLHVQGLTGWSMAEHLANRGAIVVALDHLGVGASSPVDDVFLVTPLLLAAVHAHALQIVRTMVGSEVWTVGLGHSMGGMLATVLQAHHRSFDALAVLGHGGEGLPQFISDLDRPTGEALHDHLPALARAHIAPPARWRSEIASQLVFPARRPRPGPRRLHRRTGHTVTQLRNGIHDPRSD